MPTGGLSSHGDLGSHRIKRDQNDVTRLHDQIKQYNPFGRDCEGLVCISTSDVAPDDIKEDLLSASTHGKEKLQTIVQQHLSLNASRSLYDMIPKNKSKTFATMNNVQVVTKSGDQKIVKVDRDLFRRLLVAAHSGRKISLHCLLKHELAPVPLSIATTNQKLRTGDKAALFHILSDNHVSDAVPATEERACVIIDGMALVHSLSKPVG